LKFPGATADLIATKNMFDVFLKTKVLDICGDAMGKENLPEEHWAFYDCLSWTDDIYLYLSWSFDFETRLSYKQSYEQDSKDHLERK
jgi:hypothetical protein